MLYQIINILDISCCDIRLCDQNCNQKYTRNKNQAFYFAQLTQQKHVENQRHLEEAYASEMESKQRKLAALRNLANSPDVVSGRSGGPRPPVAPKPIMRSRAVATSGQPAPGSGMVRRLRQNFSPPPPHANQRYQVSWTPFNRVYHSVTRGHDLIAALDATLRLHIILWHYL